MLYFERERKVFKKTVKMCLKFKEVTAVIGYKNINSFQIYDLSADSSGAFG